VAGYGWNEKTLRRRALLLILMTSLLVPSFSSLARASTPVIDKAKSEAQALSDLIAQLDVELGAATEDFNYAKQQLKDTQAAAKKTSTELTRAEKDLASAQGHLSQRVVDIYKAGDLSLLDVLLDANSFSELVARFDQLTRLSKQDAQLVKRVQAYKAQAADRKAKLDSELQQQKTYQAKSAESGGKAEERPQGQRSADRAAQESRGGPAGQIGRGGEGGQSLCCLQTREGGQNGHAVLGGALRVGRAQSQWV
jgi:peptidoglycan hydrolase CwlO-like protein